MLSCSKFKSCHGSVRNEPAPRSAIRKRHRFWACCGQKMATSEVDISTREMSSRYAYIWHSIEMTWSVCTTTLGPNMNLSLLYDYDQFYSALHIEVDPWLDQRKVDCHCGYSKPAQELDLDSRIASFPHIPFLPVLSLFTVLHIVSRWLNPLCLIACLYECSTSKRVTSGRHRAKWKNFRWFLSGSLGKAKYSFPHMISVKCSPNLRWCCEWFPSSARNDSCLTERLPRDTTFLKKCENYQAELTLLAPVMLETTTHLYIGGNLSLLPQT